LIELILVILLVAIIAGLSSPVFRNSFTSLELKDACFNIAKLANYAQEMAIVERASYKLSLDAQTGKFWLSRSDLLNPGASYQKVKGSYGESFSLPRGISFAVGNELVELFFYPDGRLQPEKQVKISAVNGESRLINFKSLGSQVEIKAVN